MNVAELERYFKENGKQGREHIAIQRPDGTFDYNIEVVSQSDSKFNLDSIVAFQTTSSPNAHRTFIFEVVREDGNDNTWPYKVKRNDGGAPTVMGKFKDAYVANIFCEYLNTNYTADMHRRTRWAQNLISGDYQL